MVNKIGESDKGFKNVVVDYSLNGSSWTELGTFQFEQGMEEAIYSGFEGADFGGISARYVLITSLSNWGDNSCSGISDIKFNIAPPLLQDVTALLTARQALTDDYLNTGLSTKIPRESLLIYPNPAKEITAIALESDLSMAASIQLVGVMGNAIKSFDVEIVKGQNAWSFPLAGVPSGTYFIKIRTESTNPFKPQKLIVVKE